MYAWALPAHPQQHVLSIVWVHSFIEPDLRDNNVPCDNTTLIYLINLLWKLGLEFGSLFQHFQRLTKTSTLSSTNFTEGNILQRTQTINNVFYECLQIN